MSDFPLFLVNLTMLSVVQMMDNTELEGIWEGAMTGRTAGKTTKFDARSTCQCFSP
jgi:hypothetical protein